MSAATWNRSQCTNICHFNSFFFLISEKKMHSSLDAFRMPSVVIHINLFSSCPRFQHSGSVSFRGQMNHLLVFYTIHHPTRQTVLSHCRLEFGLYYSLCTVTKKVIKVRQNIAIVIFHLKTSV